MRRIFADSSLLIAGCGSRTGASRAVLTMAEIGLFKLVVSGQSERRSHFCLVRAIAFAVTSCLLLASG